MTDRYAVLGNPVAHSQSPFIHARFAAQTGQSIRYEARAVPRDGFAAAVAEFQAAGGKGLNVTLPFKEQAYRLMDETTAAAARAGAVNTVWFGAAGARHGDNTDGAGLIADLEVNHAVEIRGRRVLLVGAGGAARGAIGPLLDAAPARLLVVNRTRARAVALARAFSSAGEVAGGGLDEPDPGPFDLIVNATSASLTDSVPRLRPSVVAPTTVCYDMVYADRPTAFVRWGERAGAARSLDGLGMLVEQAAIAFARWRGVRPRTAAVIRALRKRVGASKKS